MGLAMPYYVCTNSHYYISTILWGNSVCRYWEAISHWDMALELTPDCVELHEMKAQVSMCAFMWVESASGLESFVFILTPDPP